MSNNYESQYSLSAIIQLLNPDNTISAHRMLAHAIGMTETVIYAALISKQTYYLQNHMLQEGGWFFSTITDLQESTTFGAKAQKTAIGNLISHGLIECECKGMPAKRYFRITNNMEIPMKLIDKGTEICKKLSAKANRNSYENYEISNENPYEKSEILEDVESLEKAVQTAEKSQYLPKAVTDEGAQSSRPSAVTCTRPAENHTIKPKINNLKLNQSINRNAEKIDRLNSAPMKFSEVMENIGLDWFNFTANEPMSEKHFLYHDENDRKTQKCKIPYSLKNDKQAMKAALRYLCGYSYYFSDGNNENQRSFWETLITSLAEMIENDSVKISGRTVMYHEIIDRLNEIIRRGYLSECFFGFEEHWQDLIAEKEIKYPKAYLKSCFWNWLCDYEFEDFNDYAKMKNI